jgi:hypothetical protein
MKTTYLVPFLSISLLMCKNVPQEEKAIKNDLESRFTGFEIVEIKKDSAEVSNAMNYSNSCKIVISSNNLEIVKAIGRYQGMEIDENMKVLKIKPWSFDKLTKYADSISDESFELVNEYMHLQFSKSEPCYYVKYRVFDGANKIEKEEYYQYREGANEWIHRPCDWDEWLLERGDTKLFDEATATYKQLLLDVLNGEL